MNQLDDDLQESRKLRFMKKSIREDDSDDDFDDQRKLKTGIFHKLLL